MIPENRIPAHPGAILLREFLEPLELSAEELARHLGVLPATLETLAREETSVTPELAWGLSQSLGTTPEFWLQLQVHHDLAAHRPAETVPPLVQA